MGELTHPADNVELRDPHRILGGGSFEDDHVSANGRFDGSTIPPQHAISALPAWNQNKANIFKTLSTFVAFVIMGANDAAYGVSTCRPRCKD